MIAQNKVVGSRKWEGLVLFLKYLEGHPKAFLKDVCRVYISEA